MAVMYYYYNTRGEISRVYVFVRFVRLPVTGVEYNVTVYMENDIIGIANAIRCENICILVRISNDSPPVVITIIVIVSTR